MRSNHKMINRWLQTQKVFDQIKLITLNPRDDVVKVLHKRQCWNCDELRFGKLFVIVRRHKLGQLGIKQLMELYSQDVISINQILNQSLAMLRYLYFSKGSHQKHLDRWYHSLGFLASEPSSFPPPTISHMEVAKLLISSPASHLVHKKNIVIIKS